MLSAAGAKAASLEVAYNVAVVDAGGHLVAFLRQDGAPTGSIELAIGKATTARLFDKDDRPISPQWRSRRQAAFRHPGKQRRQSHHL